MQDYEKTLKLINSYVTGYQPKYFNEAISGYKISEWSAEDRLGFIYYLFENKDFGTWPDYLLYYNTMGAILRTEPDLKPEDMAKLCDLYQDHLEFFDASGIVDLIALVPDKHDETVDKALEGLLEAISSRRYVFPERAKAKAEQIDKLKKYLRR